MISLFLFLAGLAIGSFLHLVADRTPAGVSLLRPRSYCDACGTPLTPVELIPVLSYLLQKGRCRHCRARFSISSTVVEVMTGLLFVFSYLRWGLTPVALLYVSIFSLCLLMAIIDFRTQYVYDRHLLVLGILLFFLLIVRRDSSLLSIPGIVIWLLLARLLKEKMGDGDKILIGILLLGLSPGLQVRFLAYSVWSAAIVAVILLLRGADRKTPIPFVPFLTLGFLLVHFIHGGSA